MKRLIILITLIFTIACSNPKDDIIGKWKNDKSQMEFFKDGTLSIKKDDGQIDGKWSIIDDDRLKMTIGMMGITQTQVGKIKINNNTLTITNEDTGKDTKFVKN